MPRTSTQQSVLQQPPIDPDLRASASHWPRELREVLASAAPALDFLCVLLAARLATLAYAALPLAAAPPPSGVWNPWERGALLGAVLAPLLLRVPCTGMAGLLAEFLPKYGLFLGLVLLTGLASGLLAAVPVAWLGLWLGLSLVMILGARLALARPVQRENVAIIGSGPAARQLIDYLRASRRRDINLLGVFDDRRDTRGEGGCERHGNVGDLVELGKRRMLDWVLLALPGQAEQRLSDVVHLLKSLDVPVGLCPQGLGRRLPWAQVEYVAGKLPVTLLSDRPIKRWGVAVKAFEDYVIGGLITLLALPLMGLIALAIRLEGPGPIFFRQKRHAWNNAEFDVLKFRSMRWEPDAVSRPLVQTERDDPRITPLGRFLRRSSLDELPQLLNVVRGEMSLVGPRPHAVDMRTEQRLGHEIIGAYAHRHRVKPGITGWAQVHGSRGATDTVEQLRRRVEYDLEYIERWSFWLDLKILFQTVWIVLRGTNAY